MERSMVLNSIGHSEMIWVRNNTVELSVDITMTIVASNGDYCRIFALPWRHDDLEYTEDRVNAVRAFMENHR